MMHNTIRLLIFVFVVWGCDAKLNSIQTFINDNIQDSIKSEILPLDNRVIKAIKTNYPDDLKDLYSSELLENGQDNLDSIFNVIYEPLKEAEFEKFDYLYVVNATKNVSNTILSGLTSDNDYIIHYIALEKEVFISLYRAKINLNELLITLIYGKTNNGWKLFHLQFGNYSLYGKNAIDYYKIARAYDSVGYLIDAANTLSVAQQILKPANQLWQYRKEKDILDLRKSLMDKINKAYQFPFVLEQVKTKPQIFQIYHQLFKDQYVTFIKYYSHIDLIDTIQLKNENLEIRKEIGKQFKGIDKGKKYLIYQASNELPTDTLKQVTLYGFIQEFKEE